jgi:transposase, IS30 family
MEAAGRVRRSRRRPAGAADRAETSDLMSASFSQVAELLRQKWSPEQIAGRLKRDGLLSISHETIYRYVWEHKRRSGTLHRYLRCATKQRQKRYRSYDSRGRLAGKRHISERPASVERRTRLGHWEIDTVMGGGDQHCIVTLVERKSGYTVIGKLKACTKEEAARRTTWLIGQYAHLFRTTTADNGTAFHSDADVEAATGVKFYFATPHHSWERGTNEKLIRQYLPKRTSMNSVTQQQCSAMPELLNKRPRKRLGYSTPRECVYGY